MNKKDIKYYAVIAIILTVTIVFEILKPKPIDWRFTLESEEKEPYGTYVLFNTLDDLFPGITVSVNPSTTYEHNQTNNSIQKNYIYITDNFNIDALDTEVILRFLEEGNTMFISAHTFSKEFTDTLAFSIQNSAFFDTTSNLNFYNYKLKRQNPYFFGKTASNYYFENFDTTNVQVLAFSKDRRPIFIKQKIGKGELFLNTSPEVFTNYAMITEKNFDFAYNALSYLSVKDIIWDEYYKPYRKQNKTEMSVILGSPGFKTAYRLLLIMTLFFVLFTIKRKQRIVPVLKPFQNRTLDFVETIGRVYYHSKNHKDIALKKYQYFKSFLFNKYKINLSERETVDNKQISEKTGVHEDIIKKLLLTHGKINKLEKISAEQLNRFNNYIEDFYDNSK